MNRSKRCVGCLKQVHLVEPFVLPLLIADVFADRRLVGPHRRHEVAPCPEMVARKIFPPSDICPGNVDRALAFDKPDDLGYRIFRRNRDQHMHVVDHQVSLLDLGLSLLGQVVKDLAQMLAKLSVQGLAAVFRDKHYVVLAFPLRMVQALV